MALQPVEKIWRNGELVGWHEAQTHVLSHAIHYGTSVFEGIRVYETPEGPRTFRLRDHMKRLIDSAHIYSIEFPYDVDALCEASNLTVRENGLKSAYVRPFVFIGYGSIGVMPTADSAIETCIAAFPWGAYLGEEARTKGVRVCVSSWNRAAPNTTPTGAKAGGNYLNSVLVTSEAKKRGYAEGIALDSNNLLSEGAGENLFLVLDGKIYTPPVTASILKGITRDTVMTLARAEGIEVIEQALPREMLYLCDEAFFTGTAAEVTPIQSVDDKPTRANGPGEVSNLIMDRFFGLFEGRTEDKWGWLTPID